MGTDTRRAFGIQLLALAAKADAGLQSDILRFLANQVAYRDNIPRARFTAVLNGLAWLATIPVEATAQIVTTYSTFAVEMNLDWTDASSLPADLAVQLVATAFTQTESVRDDFLIPFDSIKLLRDTPKEENLSLGPSIARTLRTHIRMLARAVAGWPNEEVPLELGEALLSLVTKNVIEHAEKWRVGALTDRYKPSHVSAREEGSPARDIAAAWRRLNSDHRKSLLLALVQTDDPVLLAELCQFLPAEAKTSILAKLRYLRPDEASKVWMWPEVQHRVEALLASGEYSLAREHLESVQADLHRAPQQFRLNLYSLGLQLLMMEKDWASLDSAVVPSSLDQATTRQATEYLAFYKATSQLLRADGNLDQARVVLERLAANPNAPTAYRQNVFAVAIRQLIGPTPRPLDGLEKVTAETLLDQINSAIAGGDNAIRTNLLANRAQLLLALRRPDEALRSVASHRLEAKSVDLELVAVRANVSGKPTASYPALPQAGTISFMSITKEIDHARGSKRESA